MQSFEREGGGVTKFIESVSVEMERERERVNVWGRWGGDTEGRVVAERSRRERGAERELKGKRTCILGNRKPQQKTG